MSKVAKAVVPSKLTSPTSSNTTVHSYLQSCFDKISFCRSEYHFLNALPGFVILYLAPSSELDPEVELMMISSAFCQLGTFLWSKTFMNLSRGCSWGISFIHLIKSTCNQVPSNSFLLRTTANNQIITSDVMKLCSASFIDVRAILKNRAPQNRQCCMTTCDE